jgi:hypothetical protein
MDMQKMYKKIPQLIKEREAFEGEANVPTYIRTHKCFCGKGEIDHCRVPGFSDEYFEFRCEVCEEKYHPIIDRSGDEWIVYPKDEI